MILPIVSYTAFWPLGVLSYLYAIFWVVLHEMGYAINSLEEEDKKLIAEMERAAAGLGRIMALSVDRKVKIDAKYMGEAKQFSEQLKTNSKITHNAFKDQAKTQFWNLWPIVIRFKKKTRLFSWWKPQPS